MATTLYVQFSDSTQETIWSYFVSRQDESVWPNQGTVETSDARWKTFYDAMTSAGLVGIPSATAD